MRFFVDLGHNSLQGVFEQGTIFIVGGGAARLAGDKTFKGLQPEFLQVTKGSFTWAKRLLLNAFDQHAI